MNLTLDFKALFFTVADVSVLILEINASGVLHWQWCQLMREQNPDFPAPFGVVAATNEEGNRDTVV